MVIGGDAAGMSAASQARRRRDDLDVVVFERGRYTSYSACGIPYVVSGDVDSIEALVARSPEQHRANRIDVRMGHEVTAVDLDARRVTVWDHGRSRELQLGFDHLLFGTGARPLRPPIDGIDADFVHGVQTLDDATHLLEHARVSRARRVVVVGGGYIGIEMAEAFQHWGAEVTVLDAAPHVMRTFDADMAARIETAMRSHGIEVRTGVGVSGFEPGHVLVGDERIPADLVVLGLGVVPNSELAAEAGVAVGARGAIMVDRRQATSAAGVWAAGDCAETFHRVSERWMHVALGTVANRAGRVAGINIAGGYASFPGVVGTAVSKVCATEVARTGLNETEAAAAGFDYRSATIEATTRAGYYPGARPMAVKMLAERGTGRVLGAQIVGEEGAAKRIDVVATAITARLTVADLIDLDLSYAPPFSSVWDPVAIAARAVDAAR